MRLLIKASQQLSIEEQITNKIYQAITHMNKSNEFIGKEYLLKESALFLQSLISALTRDKFNSINTSDLPNNILSNVISSLIYILRKSNKEKTIVRVLSAVEMLIKSKYILPNGKFQAAHQTDNTLALKDIIDSNNTSTEALMNLVVIDTIRFHNSDIILDAGLSVLNTAAEASREYISMILIQGIGNMFLPIFRNLDTPPSIAQKVLKLIGNLLDDDQGLYILAHLKISKTLLSYISAHKYSRLLIDSTRSPLQKLMEKESETKSREAQKLLDELLDSLEAEDEGMNMLCLTEMFEQISNLTLVNQNITYLVKNKAPFIFIKQIEKEITVSMKSLSLHKISGLQRRMIDNCLFALVQIRLYCSPNDLIMINQEFLRLNASEIFINILKLAQDYPQTVLYTLTLIVSILYIMYLSSIHHYSPFLSYRALMSLGITYQRRDFIAKYIKWSIERRFDSDTQQLD